MEKIRLSKYEKETILLTSEGEDTYNIYTFNQSLKSKLARFAKKYPGHCQLQSKTKEGAVTYLVDKSRVSIHLNAPLTDDRKKDLRSQAKMKGLI